jgi:hypothetical protein
MRKNFTLSIILVSCYFGSAIAQIPNGDFEDWTDFGSYENPDSWITSNDQDGSGTETVKLTEDAFSGISAARLENEEDDNGNVVVATLISGNTLSGKTGFAYSQRPAFLQGYYMYKPKNGNDSCYIIVRLTHFNTVSQSTETIGTAVFSSADESEEYLLFSSAINYSSPTDPDTATIEIRAGKFSGGNEGSRLYVDALTFEDAATGVSQPATSFTQPLIFPNPAQDVIGINTSINTSAILTITDPVSNKVLKSLPVTGHHQQFSLGDLLPGVYIYRLINERSNVGSGKLVIQ